MFIASFKWLILSELNIIVIPIEAKLRIRVKSQNRSLLLKNAESPLEKYLGGEASCALRFVPVLPKCNTT